MEQKDDQDFRKESNFWIDEINGNVARLNDAAAVMEADIVLPSPTDNPLTKAQKITTIRNFQVEFRRLYKNSRQILSPEIQRKLQKWFDATSNAKSIINIELLKEGLQLSDKLQDYLAEHGAKQIGEPDIIEFPYEYYYDMVVNQNEERDK
jgi:hypothetical protein